MAALVASDRYTITVLTRSVSQNSFRAASASKSLKLIQVDYESFESLRGALEGQDILISVLGKAALAAQPLLINAAVAANVKRIIPSEFGSDLKNPKTRCFPTYQLKVEAEEQLERCWAESGVSYTLIYNNTLLDWGLSDGLLMNPLDRTVKLYDDGEAVFSTTTMATVGRSVVGVLENFRETQNRAVYIHDIAITQNELVEMAREATKNDGGKEWTITRLDTARLEAAALSDLEKGLLSPTIFYGFAVRAAFADGYGGQFKNVDNEMLGVGLMSKQAVRDLVFEIVTQKNK